MKILASDYDGTLNHNGFDSLKLDAIARWRAAGNLFGLVSGRSADALWELVDRDGFGFDFMIANNGAVVLDHNRHVLHAQRCDGRLVLPLLRAMFDLGCPSAYLTAEHTSVIQPSEIAALPSIPWFYQISTFLSAEQEALEISSRLRSRFGDHLNPLPNGTCIDCVPAGVNKAQGLYRLVESLGANAEDVITVGDQMNDADMLSAFRSYAMSNGAEAIRNLADEVIPGVPELIDREL